MFVIYDSKHQLIPIKVWLQDIDQLEATCLQQAINLANLPFAKKWIVLLPDTHTGFGMPIGGVLATDNTIIPNAVGVDIGCGMTFVQTNIPGYVLTDRQDPSNALAQRIVDRILAKIPTGFEHHKTIQPCRSVDAFVEQLKTTTNTDSNYLIDELDKARYQVGTLGGGNHFIELQTNENGHVAIMIHSGSRNIGYKICNHFNKQFKQVNIEMKSSIPPSWDLAHLPADSALGSEYIRWMQFSMAFAKENRAHMMDVVTDIVYDQTVRYGGFMDITMTEPIDCHHNYADLEEHDVQMLWVHRKGAIHVKKDAIGIIPGAMGSYSYIVKGKGNPESFFSCSHGAGRVMSRKSAKKQFDVNKTILDLKDRGVFIGKVKKGDIGEESRFAYKDIDVVINDQLDLITPISKLKTLAVVKG